MYQSLAMTHKIILSGTPYYLKEKCNTDNTYRTRKASTGSISTNNILKPKNQHNYSSNSFSYRSIREYNSLPNNIRSVKTIKAFKLKLKRWVKSNIAVD